MLASDYTNILLDLKDILVKNVIAERDQLCIFIENKVKPHTCPACASSTTYIHDYRYQTVKDISIQAKRCLLILRKRRYVCRQCRKRFAEESWLVSRYQRMTNRLEQYLLSLFASTRSIKSIAEECNCSLSTASRHFEKIVYPKAQLPSILAIDEFRGNAGGHKFQCILSDPKQRTLLDILPVLFISSRKGVHQHNSLILLCPNVRHRCRLWNFFAVLFHAVHM